MASKILAPALGFDKAIQSAEEEKKHYSSAALQTLHDSALISLCPWGGRFLAAAALRFFFKTWLALSPLAQILEVSCGFNPVLWFPFVLVAPCGSGAGFPLAVVRRRHCLRFLGWRRFAGGFCCC
jgi:hypothetical protein